MQFADEADDQQQDSIATGPPDPLLAALFAPRSVAIVGSSGKESSLTSRPLKYLQRSVFAGGLFPVNPHYDEILGIKCYPSLAAIEEPVDLVLSMVPAAGVADVVRQAGAIGAHAVVVFASGFAETGQEGLELQNELAATARESNIRVLGPNCQGIINSEIGLIGTFTGAADRDLPAPSGVAYVGQSGAIGGSVLDLATEMGLGLSAWASTGNQADLSLVEVATALLDDQRVRVVLLYAEGITEGASFVALATKARSLGKRLVMLRSGRSSVGRKAAASHTGAMLGDDISLVLTAQNYGVILVDDVDELLAVGATLTATRPMNGRRVGIVTTSGGAGILAADHLARHDIDVPELSVDTQTALSEHVPDFGATSNPVDVTAQIFNKTDGVKAFGDVCVTVANDPAVDAVAVVLTMVVGERAAQLAAMVVEISQRIDKPIVASWLAGREQTVDGRAVYREHGFPVFASVGDMARTVGYIAPTERANQEQVPHLDDEGPFKLLDEWIAGRVESDDLLDALAIARPRSVVVTTTQEAARVAVDIGTNVAMKLRASGLGHKSDVGGVSLDIAPRDAATEFDRLLDVAAANGIEADGVLIQQMIPAGVELIVGATSTGDGFPATVTVGIGGVTTEIYQDVVSQIAPVSNQTARQMLEKLRGWTLLDGFRGSPVADVEAVVEVVVAVGRLIAQFADRSIEFEINPLVVAAKGQGACAVDVLISTTSA